MIFWDFPRYKRGGGGKYPTCMWEGVILYSIKSTHTSYLDEWNGIEVNLGKVWFVWVTSKIWIYAILCWKCEKRVSDCNASALNLSCTFCHLKCDIQQKTHKFQHMPNLTSAPFYSSRNDVWVLFIEYRITPSSLHKNQFNNRFAHQFIVGSLTPLVSGEIQYWADFCEGGMGDPIFNKKYPHIIPGWVKLGGGQHRHILKFVSFLLNVTF